MSCRAGAGAAPFFTAPAPAKKGRLRLHNTGPGSGYVAPDSSYMARQTAVVVTWPLPVKFELNKLTFTCQKIFFRLYNLQVPEDQTETFQMIPKFCKLSQKYVQKEDTRS